MSIRLCQVKDYPTIVLLQWFINAQVEEEKNAKLIADELRMAGDNLTALLLDRELGARTPEAQADAT